MRSVSAMAVLRTDIERDIEAAARSNVDVLITGGDTALRQRVARRVHQGSDRHTNPFITMLELDLGDMEAASRSMRGTLFIEDVGQLTFAQQAKLMCMLDHRNELGWGSPMEWRLAAACGCPLYERVVSGQFRADLFYRVNVVHVIIPEGLEGH